SKNGSEGPSLQYSITPSLRSSRHHRAAVDVNRLAGHAGEFVRGDEHGKISHFLGIDQPVLRRAAREKRENLRFGFPGSLRHPARVIMRQLVIEIAGTDRVDGDA